MHEEALNLCLKPLINVCSLQLQLYWFYCNFWATKSDSVWNKMKRPQGKINTCPFPFTHALSQLIFHGCPDLQHLLSQFAPCSPEQLFLPFPSLFLFLFLLLQPLRCYVRLTCPQIKHKSSNKNKIPNPKANCAKAWDEKSNRHGDNRRGTVSFAVDLANILHSWVTASVRNSLHRLRPLPHF